MGNGKDEDDWSYDGRSMTPRDILVRAGAIQRLLVLIFYVSDVMKKFRLPRLIFRRQSARDCGVRDEMARDNDGYGPNLFYEARMCLNVCVIMKQKDPQHVQRHPHCG